MKGKTYQEGKLFYAVVSLPSGWTYYAGKFNSRSAAYRFSVKETAKHRFAHDNGFIYNTKV